MAEEEPSPSPQTGRIRDARGRKVMLIDPVVLHYLRRHEVIAPKALGAMAREIGSGWPIPGQAIFATLWGIVLVAMVIAHFVKWGGGLGFYPRERRLLVVLAVLFVINIVVVWFSSRFVRRKKVSRILLRHSHCPHCGYDLHGLPADEEDGATICPECGCAWRLDTSQTYEEKR
jgi:predicted RNA-binding Zn-ribbon protein involved in translation (DUF1610 family)